MISTDVSRAWLSARSRIVAVSALLALLSGCGGSGSSSGASPDLTSAALGPSQAQLASFAVVSTEPGVSPFISFVVIGGKGIEDLAGVEFTIAPKPGSVSKPVDVWTSIGSLTNRGYVSTSQFTVRLPVFGLYAGFTNLVTIQMQFQDGSTQPLTAVIQTPAYNDPSGIYGKPNILTKRVAGSSLGYDFIFLKSGLGAPVIIDTDAEIRWTVPGISSAISSIWKDNQFVIGSASSPTVTSLQLDGTVTEGMLTDSTYTMFHHNLDPGKHGIFAGLEAVRGSVASIESNVVEMTSTGSILARWDLEAIISAYMKSQGDDPSLFVRPGVDWFHNNASTYDPSDDSIIVSSREDFVIKLDYRTGAIIWIFGDPTKYWYTFPSLRAKALSLVPGGLYPIGQHGTSITPAGYLMLFNDGLGSGHQPAGAPTGETRSYSEVSVYSIDKTAMTAQEVSHYDAGQAIFSPVCGSVYQAAGNSLLIDFATANNFTQTILIGLDGNQNTVFEFEYPTVPCNTSWNSVPFPFENLNYN